MKTTNRLMTLTVGSTVVFLCLALRAEDASESKWRVGVGYRAMFNVDVSIRNAGAAAAANNPSATGRSYADGFVGVDDIGNALDLTTYWGYERAEQYAGDAIVLRNSQPGALGEDKNLWANGFELVVGRELGQGRNVRWGLEGGFSYAHVDGKWSGVAQARVLSLDAFPLAGVEPPEAPYSGPQASGPGIALLGATPTTVPFSVAARVEADVYGFRLGPYFEFPVAKCCSLTLGGGLSLAVVDSTASFRGSAAAPYSAFAQSARDSEADVVVGGYVSSGVNVRIAKHWDAFSSIQFHALQDFDQRVGDKKVRLDMGAAFAWLIGVQYRF